MNLAFKQQFPGNESERVILWWHEVFGCFRGLTLLCVTAPLGNRGPSAHVVVGAPTGSEDADLEGPEQDQRIGSKPNPCLLHAVGQSTVHLVETTPRRKPKQYAEPRSTLAERKESCSQAPAPKCVANTSDSPAAGLGGPEPIHRIASGYIRATRDKMVAMLDPSRAAGALVCGSVPHCARLHRPCRHGHAVALRSRTWRRPRRDAGLAGPRPFRRHARIHAGALCWRPS